MQISFSTHDNYYGCWLVGLMVFNATFNNISVISWRQFYWWWKPEYPEKTTDLSQVTGKLYHIMLYTSPWSRFELTTSVVRGTDCIGNCKTNYHTIAATTAPNYYGIIHLFIYYYSSPSKSLGGITAEGLNSILIVMRYCSFTKHDLFWNILEEYEANFKELWKNAK